MTHSLSAWQTRRDIQSCGREKHTSVKAINNFPIADCIISWTTALQEFSREVANMVEDLYQNGEIDDMVKDYFYNPSVPPLNSTCWLRCTSQIDQSRDAPIISGCNGPTERISQFVDHFLNPTTKSLPSYVKDTTHFLQILEDLGPLPPNCLIDNIDVSSLYTNIDQSYGLKASKETVHKSHPQPRI